MAKAELALVPGNVPRSCKPWEVVQENACMLVDVFELPTTTPESLMAKAEL
jgi:hypothetical protein